MLGVVGTVPNEDFPLMAEEISLDKDHIKAGRIKVQITRGTPALLAAAIKTGEVLGLPLPVGFLVGDTGVGHGSKLLYKHLTERLPDYVFKVITFHYLLPDVDWHNRVLFAVEEMIPPPILIADAGFMYVAKMSGQAEAYELFTPDVGELAFLADEEAPHPFYTRGFILHEEERIPYLINRAYEHGNASHYLLVKGEKDHVASKKGIHAIIDSPADDALEAIGGTGDTLTGIVSVLIASGIETLEAAILAARINRVAGHYAKPTPASQVMELIGQIPKAMYQVLSNREEYCGQQ